MMFIGKIYGGGGNIRVTQLRGQRVVFVSIYWTGKIGKCLGKNLNNRTITTTIAPDEHGAPLLCRSGRGYRRSCRAKIPGNRRSIGAQVRLNYHYHHRSSSS